MAVLRFEEGADIEPHIRRKNVPNPQKAYNEIVDILMMRCDIDKDDIDEGKYEHSREGETEIIHSEIEAVKPFDKFSEVVIEVELDIEMRPVKGEEYDYVGDLEVELKGKVRTDYPQENILQKSMIWHAMRVFYEKLLYNDVKEVYKNKVNKYVRILRDDLKSYFDMLPTIS